MQLHRNRFQSLVAAVGFATLGLTVVGLGPVGFSAPAHAQEDGASDESGSSDTERSETDSGSDDDTSQPEDQPIQDQPFGGQEKPLASYVSEAQTKMNEMQAIRQVGLRKLEEARKSKDALALQCVNENLATIKAMVSLGTKAKSGVERAVASGDRDKAKREMGKLNAAASKTSQAGASVRNCAGGDAVDTSTEVEVLVDESIGDSDPYYGNNGQFSDPANNVVNNNGGTTSAGTDSGTTNPPPPPTTGFQ